MDVVLYWLIWASWITLSRAVDLTKCKSIALGMENNLILDNQITASSSFDLQSVGPQNGRIRTEKASGAWCPKQQIKNDSYEFLQVNFYKNIVFRAIETQGRYGNGTGKEYAEKYFVDYWRTGNQWTRYRNRSGHQLMDGNYNTERAELCILDPPIIASKIRIVPFSSVTRTTCLRMELYGCTYSDGILAYSYSKAPSTNYSDLLLEETHLKDSSQNKKGLGLLTDGYIADGFPTSSTTLNASWLGWTQKSTDGNVEILFEFDDAKEFSVMKMFAIGQLPDEVVVNLYEDGDVDDVNAKSIRFSQFFDSSLAENVTAFHIPLQGYAAKYIRATIIFSAPWLYLTEVYFVEDPINFGLNNNATVPPFTNNENEQPPEVYYFIVFFLLAIFLLLLLYFCILFLVKRARSSNKLGTTSARNSFYSKPGILVTTLGGNGAPKQVIQNTFLPGSRSQDFSQQLKPSLYATVNGFGGQKQRMIGHRSQAIFCTSSLSRNCEESNKSKSKRNKSPSLLTFHFPPPPTSTSTTSEEIVYAEPCVYAPLLPYRLKTSASASLVAINPKSPYRKPVPKPRSFRDFRNRTLPSRAIKNVTYKSSRVLDENSVVLQEKRDSTKQTYQKAVPLSSVQIIDKIGEGKFTQIHKCRLLENKDAVVVMKTAKLEYIDDSAAKQALLAEFEVMSRLSDNPLFVKLIGQCEDFSLLTEFIELGNIRSAIKANPSNFNSTNLIQLCTSIAAGMKYLETLKIVHGHLSPRSCLLDANLNVKIASPRGPNLHAQLRYSAPEAIVLDTWSSKTDVWSFATTCWELLHMCIDLPFSAMSNAQIVDNCQNILERSPNAVFLSFAQDLIGKDTLELLKDCWNADSSLRPTFLEIQLFFMRQTMKNSDVL